MGSTLPLEKEGMSQESFSLEDYINSKVAISKQTDESNMAQFKRVCLVVENTFEKDFVDTDDEAKGQKLQREKRAIMGYEYECNYYKEKIKDIINEKKLSETYYPKWYPNLHEAIFAEVYGLSALAPWAYDMTDEYKNSQSAKLIGDRLYCLINGKEELQPQRIDRERREKLKRALLLSTPRERIEYGFHEVYLHNGIRITIFSGERTKDDQDVMIFRKYLVKNFSFEKLCDLGTLPKGAIELFEIMTRIGFNVLFVGPVRSGKTTFLQTWQCYEDKSLEGVAISTDPETPWHKIFPEGPLMQIVADGSGLDNITKSLLRGDNDYIVLEEMRDAQAFKLAFDITSTGARRCKGTIHDGNSINVPFKMGSEVAYKYGGSIDNNISLFYKNFDFAIELCQDKDNKGLKLMKSIVAFDYDYERNRVKATFLCKYDFTEKDWTWSNYDLKSKLADYSEFVEEIEVMQKIISSLSRDVGKPGWEIYPAYYSGNLRQNHEC